MFGRESLRDFMRGEQQSTRELIQRLHQESMRDREQTREFHREILLRNEKVYTRVLAELGKGAGSSRKGASRLPPTHGRFSASSIGSRAAPAPDLAQPLQRPLLT